MILVVDDVAANRFALTELLGGPGRTLIEASSGLDALRILRKERVSLILLDVEMPGMDGYETARLIRGTSRLRDVPIIFQTAHSTTDERVVSGYKLGAVDFILKPIVPQILRARVEVFLELQRRSEQVNRQAQQLRVAYERVAQAEARYRAVLEEASDALIVADEDGVVEIFNASAGRLFGYSADEVIGSSARRLITDAHSGNPALEGADAWAHIDDTREVIGHLKDGTDVPLEMSLGVLVADGRPLFAAIVRDITESKHVVESLQRQAESDPLTGLPNRVALGARLEDPITDARRAADERAVLFVDLDGFKQVNDECGHAVGDAVLVEVARRLREVTRDNDLVARVGGDEFCVLLDHFAPGETVDAVADRVVDALAQPYEVLGSRVEISASVGAATLEHGHSGAVAIERADQAMYVAKSLGGRRAVRAGASPVMEE